MKAFAKPLHIYLWSAAIALSVIYCFLLGVLSLKWPLNGVDFKIFYVAGLASVHGLNPYLPGIQNATFAYPPNWIPFCMLFTLLPFTVSLYLWKALNIAFLFGSIALSIRLFLRTPPSFAQKSVIVCCSFVIWPVISTLFTGNTPLFSLFTLTCALFFSHKGQDKLAGISLGLALIKPPLVLPAMVYFLYRRKYAPLLIALIFTAALCTVGMYLTGATVQEYLAALKTYSIVNEVIDPTNIGMPHLLAKIGGLSYSAARELSFLLGMLSILGLYYARRAKPYIPRHGDTMVKTEDPIFLCLLLLGPSFLGARSYDMVFIIPVLVWLGVSHRISGGWRLFATCACFLLTIPQQVISIAIKILSINENFSLFVDIVLEPFRSWILLIVLLLAGLLCRENRHNSSVTFRLPVIAV